MRLPPEAGNRTIEFISASSATRPPRAASESTIPRSSPSKGAALSISTSAPIRAAACSSTFSSIVRERPRSPVRAAIPTAMETVCRSSRPRRPRLSRQAMRRTQPIMR